LVVSKEPNPIVFIISISSSVLSFMSSAGGDKQGVSSVNPCSSNGFKLEIYRDERQTHVTSSMGDKTRPKGPPQGTLTHVTKEGGGGGASGSRMSSGGNQTQDPTRSHRVHLDSA
jgi:hypothetical protein